MSLDDVVEWINARRVDPQNTRFDGRKRIGGGLSGLGRRRNLMLQHWPCEMQPARTKFVGVNRGDLAGRLTELDYGATKFAYGERTTNVDN